MQTILVNFLSPFFNESHTNIYIFSFSLRTDETLQNVDLDMYQHRELSKDAVYEPVNHDMKRHKIPKNTKKVINEKKHRKSRKDQKYDINKIRIK